MREKSPCWTSAGSAGPDTVIEEIRNGNANRLVDHGLERDLTG